MSDEYIGPKSKGTEGDTVLMQMKQSLHNLLNTPPSGMRKIDDETDAKIERLKAAIKERERAK